jgi:hypothetical protein
LTRSKLQHRVTFWIRRIPTYLGLLNFSLLFVFGAAGLVMTCEAPDIFHAGQQPSVELRDFAAPPDASDREVGELVARMLSPAHAGRPIVRRDAANQLVTEFYSVNGLVRATLLKGEHRIEVRTFRNSIWRFIDNAHATTIAEQTPDGAVRAWASYIEFSIWSLIAMSLSGLWLGLSRRWKYAGTPISLITGCIAFLALYWLER